jgi:site-specific recombinase XerD
MSEDITRFIDDLRRMEAASKTVVNYLSDLNCFARWFKGSLGEDFSPKVVTPTDIREYRAYLQTSRGAKPATANRRLAALRRFFRWAVAEGIIAEDPTTLVKGVQSVPRGPRSLEKREVDVDPNGRKRRH